MWTTLKAWFVANRKKMFEIGAIALVPIVILFSVWYASEQRVSLAQQVGALEQARVQHQRDIAAAQAENARLQALLEQQATDIQTALAGRRDLDERLDAIRTETDRRISAINRHDLEKIGAKKPKLLENRINMGSRDLFGRLRDLTK